MHTGIEHICVITYKVWLDCLTNFTPCYTSIMCSLFLSLTHNMAAVRRTQIARKSATKSAPLDMRSTISRNAHVFVIFYPSTSHTTITSYSEGPDSEQHAPCSPLRALMRLNEGNNLSNQCTSQPLSRAELRSMSGDALESSPSSSSDE